MSYIEGLFKCLILKNIIKMSYIKCLFKSLILKSF